jgi:hypothetical protein
MINTDKSQLFSYNPKLCSKENSYSQLFGREFVHFTPFVFTQNGTCHRNLHQSEGCQAPNQGASPQDRSEKLGDSLTEREDGEEREVCLVLLNYGLW